MKKELRTRLDRLEKAARAENGGHDSTPLCDRCVAQVERSEGFDALLAEADAHLQEPIDRKHLGELLTRAPSLREILMRYAEAQIACPTSCMEAA